MDFVAKATLCFSASLLEAPCNRLLPICKLPYFLVPVVVNFIFKEILTNLSVILLMSLGLLPIAIRRILILLADFYYFQLAKLVVFEL